VIVSEYAVIGELFCEGRSAHIFTFGLATAGSADCVAGHFRVPHT
jgi:hypothetical protein